MPVVAELRNRIRFELVPCSISLLLPNDNFRHLELLALRIGLSERRPTNQNRDELAVKLQLSCITTRMIVPPASESDKVDPGCNPVLVDEPHFPFSSICCIHAPASRRSCRSLWAARLMADLARSASVSSVNQNYGKYVLPAHAVKAGTATATCKARCQVFGGRLGTRWAHCCSNQSQAGHPQPGCIGRGWRIGTAAPRNNTPNNPTQRGLTWQG